MTLIWINQVNCFFYQNICTNHELSVAVIKSSFSLSQYGKVEMSAVAGYELNIGCFICVLTTKIPTHDKPNCPHIPVRVSLSDWHVITPPCLNWVKSGSTRHVLYRSCWIWSSFASVYMNCTFYTVSHWKGIYLYFYLMKSQFLL